MGIRPNKVTRWACRCRPAPAPAVVEVHDTPDGSPEVVAWLCPRCLEETHGPPPRGPGGGSPVVVRTCTCRRPSSLTVLRAASGSVLRVICDDCGGWPLERAITTGDLGPC